MSENIIPSPTPPWHRPVLSPNVETLTEDNDAGTISLTVDTTYLETDVLKATPTDPYVVALPAGNYQRQYKKIYVPKAYEITTAPWKVTGTFVGFTYLLFDNIGRAAILEWDGEGWHLAGGNAQPLD